MPRRFEEGDTCCNEPDVIPFEIVGLEKEADAPAGLVADGSLLGQTVGLGQQQPSPAGTRYGDPALAAAERRVGTSARPRTSR